MPTKQKIKGRYEIQEILGQGGMGLVYRAYDTVVKREVALKTIRDLPNAIALDLFRKECGIMAAMSHPNIVEIFDIGEFEEHGAVKPYFVMPLLPGVTLDYLIRNSSQQLTVERAIDIILQTCRGLQAAHERGLVHRDLKPRNIFVMPDHSVKIIDFGVAHMADTRTSLSIKGGTLPYMAPEQIEMKPATPLSDIFSLGVVFYETVTRRRPFDFPTDQEIIQAILRHSPPAASEINPEVSPLISRIIHKAMAKQPWNRFSSARELADTLVKVQRNEPIEIFNSERIQPRIQRAAKAFEQGNYQFAAEILSELEAEGHLDPAISGLRRQLDQAVYQKRLTELLDSARSCFEEEEYVLAMQKVQEVLQMEKNNSTARTLKASIENRLNEQKIEQWTRLARQHLENNAFTHAREALQNLLQLRPKDTAALQLLSEVDRCEQQYVQARQEKEQLYQAALEAWKNGEMSAALTKMERVIDLDRRVPDTSAPERGISYQNFYDQIRREHDAVRSAYQEASKHLRDGNFAAALALCEENLARHPGDALFQALKFDVQERQRQELSARIAEIDRRVEAEPDLDRRVNILKEALEQHPGEPHFERALRLVRDKRDLVNSIVAKARTYEERGQFNEALERWETLRTIHKQYPGLDFEIDRVFKRRDQQFRAEAKARWIEQIDRQIEAREYARALEIVRSAMNEFEGDPELAALETLAHQGQARALESQQLLEQGKTLCQQGQAERGLDCLRKARELDERDPAISAAYVDALLAEARARLDTDWAQAETLCQQALAIDSSNALARSLQTLALDRKQEEFVSRCASEARRLQATGQIQAALEQVEQGLAAYPREQRLIQLQSTLRRALAEPSSRVSTAAASQPSAPPPQEVRPEGWTELEQRLQGRFSSIEEPPPAAPMAAAVLPPAEPAAAPPRIPVFKRSAIIAAATAGVILVAAAIGAWLFWRDSAEIQKQPARAPIPAPVAPPALAEPSPRLQLASDLAGNVQLDDQPAVELQEGAFSVDPLRPGPHILKILSASGRAELKFETMRNAPAVLTEPLKPGDLSIIVITTAKGQARIYSNRGRTPILINQELKGELDAAPLELNDLADGPYELRLGAGRNARTVNFTVSSVPEMRISVTSGQNFGDLLVVTGEDGVAVTVDGKKSRLTSHGELVFSRLTVGEHVVAVFKEGFHPDQRSVSIAKGTQTKLEFKMRPVATVAALLIQGLPPGARVSLDDKPAGVISSDGSFSNNTVTPGEHTVTLHPRNFRPKSVKRTFTAGETVHLGPADFPFETILGRVRVEVTPPGARVRFRAADSSSMQDFNPGQELEEGSYVFSASAPNYEDATQAITVHGGQTTPVVLKLNPKIVRQVRPAIPSMEEWARSAGLHREGAWYTITGGTPVLYPYTPALGRFTFTAFRDGGPFTTRRIRWVTNYVDARNYVLFELDQKNLYRTEVIDGKPSPEVRKDLPGRFSTVRGKDLQYTIAMVISRDGITHFLQKDQTWERIDSWQKPDRDFSQGKMGFFLPKREDSMIISNFSFRP